MDVYDRIKMTRKALGWSQTELARKSGYAEKSMIARIENKQVDLSYTFILQRKEKREKMT